MTKQTEKPIRNNSETVINSYDTHKFMVKFLNPIDGADATFVKGPREERVTVTYDTDTNTMTCTTKTKFDEIMEQIDHASETCDGQDGDAFASCIVAKVSTEIEHISISKDTIMTFREIMAERLRSYVCADPKLNTTDALNQQQTTISGKPYTIRNLFDSDAAKIFVVDNFMTEPDCKALKAFTASHTGSSSQSTMSDDETEEPQPLAYEVKSGLAGAADPMW